MHLCHYIVAAMAWQFPRGVAQSVNNHDTHSPCFPAVSIFQIRRFCVCWKETTEQWALLIKTMPQLCTAPLKSVRFQETESSLMDTTHKCKDPIFTPKGCTLDARLTNTNRLQVCASFWRKQGTPLRCPGLKPELLRTASSHIRHNMLFVQERHKKDTQAKPWGTQKGHPRSKASCSLP